MTNAQITAMMDLLKLYQEVELATHADEKPTAKCDKVSKPKPAPAAPKPQPPQHEFTQHAGSYKIVSLDGTVTALNLRTTDLAQITKDEILLVWPFTSLSFSVDPESASEHGLISEHEFTKLAKFITM